MIVSGITLIWGIVSVFIVFRQKKAIAIMQKQLEKGTYVSNAVFDKLFEEIQKLSECLFCNYNNASVKLFPLLERVISNLPDDKKLEQMQEQSYEVRFSCGFNYKKEINEISLLLVDLLDNYYILRTNFNCSKTHIEIQSGIDLIPVKVDFENLTITKEVK